MAILKRLSIFLLILLLLALLSYFYPYLTGYTTNNQPQTTYQKEPALVTRIVDGDTIETDLGTIRLLGINTPEKGKPYSKEATDFLKEFVNKSVELLRDETDIDKYSRKLRYVFYGDRILNVEILENGLATTFMLDGLIYQEKLKTAENFARNNEIGLWKSSSDVCAPCIKLIELNPTVDFFIIKNNCDFQCNLKGWLVKDDANHFFELNSLNAFETSRYDSKTEIWNDNGDRFFMRDNKGELVVFYDYHS